MKDQTKPGGQTAGDPKPAPAGKASAPTGTRPRPPAGGQTAGDPKPAPAGKASVPAGAGGAQPGAPIPPATPTSLAPGVRAAVRGPSIGGGEKEPEERQAAARPGPPDPPADDLRLRRLSAPREQPEPAPDVKADDSPRFDVAAALKHPKPGASDAAGTQGAGPPGMLHEASERWLRDAQPDALADAIINRPRSAPGPTEPPATRAPDTTPAANAPTTAADPGEGAAGHETGAAKAPPPTPNNPATATPLRKAGHGGATATNAPHMKLADSIAAAHVKPSALSSAATPPSWLAGVPARHVKGNIWEVEFGVGGPHYVGPYSELTAFIKKAGLTAEAHHIVGDEHLKDLRSSFTYENAPAVAIDPRLHEKVITPRIGAEQTIAGGRAEQIYVGGRRYKARVPLSAGEVASIYRAVYTEQAPFKELATIADNITRQSTAGSAPAAQKAPSAKPPSSLASKIPAVPSGVPETATPTEPAMTPTKTVLPTATAQAPQPTVQGQLPVPTAQEPAVATGAPKSPAQVEPTVPQAKAANASALPNYGGTTRRPPGGPGGPEGRGGTALPRGAEPGVIPLAEPTVPQAKAADAAALQGGGFRNVAKSAAGGAAMLGLQLLTGWLMDRLHQSLYESDMQAHAPTIVTEIANRTADVAEIQSRNPDAPVFAQITTVTRMNHHHELDEGGPIDFTMYDHTTLEGVEISDNGTDSTTQSSNWIALHTLELIQIRHTYSVKLAPLPLQDLISYVREQLADVEGESERQSMTPEALEESRLHRDELLQREALLEAVKARRKESARRAEEFDRPLANIHIAPPEDPIRKPRTREPPEHGSPPANPPTSH